MSDNKTITLTETEYLALKRRNRPNRVRKVFDGLLPGEQWKKIEDGGGKYYSSNKGRFRKVFKDTSGKIHDFILKLRALNGSMGVSLTLSPGNTVGLQAGRAVLITWKPEEDPTGKFVLYKDGNYRNLELSNLSWASKKEVIDHRNALGNGRRKLVPKFYKTAYGEQKSKMVLFSDNEKEDMKKLYSEGLTQAEIAAKFGGSQAYVSKIIRNLA